MQESRWIAMKNQNVLDNLRFVYTTLESINAGRKIKKYLLQSSQIDFLKNLIKSGSSIVLENGYYLKKNMGSAVSEN